MKLRLSLVVVSLLFLGAFDGARAAQPSVPIPYQVQLRSRQFVPPPGVDAETRAALGAANKPQHVFIQLDDIPSPEQQARLERGGIRLVHYLPDRAWLAMVDPALVKTPETTTNLRWMGAIAESDKVPANLFAGKPLNHAVRPDGLVELHVKYFDDETESDAVAAVARHGGVFEQSFAVTHRISIRLPLSQIRALASEDSLEWIEEAPPPPIPEVDSIRSRIRVNEVQAAPYNLNGSGVRIGIWDCSAVGPHIDFSGRLTVSLGTTTSCPGAENHSTHVAGIMAGSGQNSQNQGGTPFQWKGMAPSATIYSYDFNHYTSTVPAAQTTYAIDLSQNSWGYAGCGAYYQSDADFYDIVVRGGFGKPIPVVFSAGNQQVSCGGYHSITPPATAKNVIAVGATDSVDDSMTYFSSWGPTDDGRTKPDVVAPGYRSDNAGGIISTIYTPTNNLYGPDFGTSMAAPSVSGMLALMLQQYRLSTGQPTANPAPSTLKALTIQGAIELGATGPDYKFGWGRVDAKNSVDLIRRGKYLEGTISQTQTINITAPIQACDGDFKVTLVWDDVPASPMASPALVNDLDLSLIAPNSAVFRPWLLDPNNPGASAGTGIDSRNNVEQAKVAFPPVGTWTIRVFGQSIPMASPQRFSLVSEALPVQPKLTSISQSVTSPGTTIVLHGSEFGCAQGSGMVTFGGGINGTVTSGNWSNDTITLTVPSNAVTGNVVVTTAGGVSSGLSLAVVRPRLYLPMIARDFPPPYNWIDASDGELVANGDEAWTTKSLPFPFTYFGNTYNNVTVSSNGFLTFDALSEAFPTASCGVPNPISPNNAIYGFWHDLDPTNLGGLNGPPGFIWYKSLGSEVVFEWQNVPRYGTVGDLETFEIILDSSNGIILQYQSVSNFADVAIGAENSTGTNGLESYCDRSPYHAGTPPPNGSLIYYSAP